jgi:hypothetical protein
MIGAHDRQRGKVYAWEERFVAPHAQLLTRYLRLPMDALLASVHAAGIDIDLGAVPVFLDAPEPVPVPPVATT